MNIFSNKKIIKQLYTTKTTVGDQGKIISWLTLGSQALCTRYLQTEKNDDNIHIQKPTNDAE